MIKTNKPKDVVDHRHFWPVDLTEMESDEDPPGRVDACSLRSGFSVVWDVDEDKILGTYYNFTEACEHAERAAKEKKGG
jgi:hypothetical protein